MRKEFLVQKEDLASHIGSGSLEVLATPVLVAWIESVCKEIAQENLTSEQSTVGIELAISHLAPTALEKAVVVDAQLVEQNRRIYTFEASAFEGETLIAKADHKRASVINEAFMAKLK